MNLDLIKKELRTLPIDGKIWIDFFDIDFISEKVQNNAIEYLECISRWTDHDPYEIHANVLFDKEVSIEFLWLKNSGDNDFSIELIIGSTNFHFFILGWTTIAPIELSINGPLTSLTDYFISKIIKMNFSLLDE